MAEGNLLSQCEVYTATALRKKRCKLVIELDSISTKVQTSGEFIN
jgi:hypothetical protein